ncbi:MAG: response regulator [Acidobacteriota bacterium]|nr:response regulator [Acidobacteriota bacterium]
MTQILVVEDNPEELLLATRLLEKAEFSILAASNGAEAMKILAKAAEEVILPDLVLTDLVMPEMDGMEVVEQVRERYPRVPVILMTAHGSGEIAFRALKKGASSYVPKRRLLGDLVQTVNNVLSVAHAQREQARLIESLSHSGFRFEIGNDQTMIASLVRFARDKLVDRFPRLDETFLMQVGMALQEALRNAMHHGNLEVSSELRRDSSYAYDELVAARLADPRFAERKVSVELDITTSEICCVVSDQGQGFDPGAVADPTDAKNILRASGRGLFLISTFMDEVRHNDVGNEITMVKNLG